MLPEAPQRGQATGNGIEDPEGARFTSCKV
jgi:hypothetical protein